MKNAHYRGIPCYYDINSGDLQGRNWYWDILVEIVVWWDVEIIEVDSFPIWIDEDR
jgi:hypothetical protein